MSEHDRPIFLPAGPDGSRPRCGGRGSRVGGPEDDHPQIAARVACFAQLRRARTAPRPVCKKTLKTDSHGKSTSNYENLALLYLRLISLSLGFPEL